MNSSSKGKSYNYFKQDLNFENYLINLDKKHYLSLIKFRTGNHRLPVETGRWANLPVNERKCHLCTKMILVMNIIICFVVVILSQRENAF